jgi:hypothetical protein
MSDFVRPDIPVLADPPLGRPRLKRLRLAFILFGLAILALVSTAFGMMMAVASDLPQLEFALQAPGGQRVDRVAGQVAGVVSRVGRHNANARVRSAPGVDAARVGGAHGDVTAFKRPLPRSHERLRTS